MTKPPVNEQIGLSEVEGVFREMTACLKTLSLYPENHPAQGPALERTFNKLKDQLKSWGSLQFGVAEEEIVFFGEDDKEHRIITDLARKLHHLGVLTFRIDPGLTEKETGIFLKHLSGPQDPMDEEKTLDRTLSEGGVTNISLTLIDYRKIIGQEPTETPDQETAGDVWSALIQKARNGDCDALQEVVGPLLHPSRIQNLNREAMSSFADLSGEEFHADSVKALSEIHQKVFENLSPDEQQEFSRNLAGMALSDEAVSAGSGNEQVQALKYYPNEMLLQVLAGAVVLQGKVDNRISAVFRNLLKDNEEESLLNMTEEYSRGKDSAGHPPEVWARLREFILSGSEDSFMSEEYHQVLEDLNKYHLMELAETIDKTYLHEVQATLHPDVLRAIRREITCELVIEENSEELIANNLVEMNAVLEEYAQHREMEQVLALLKKVFSSEGRTSQKQKRRAEVLLQAGDDSWAAYLIRGIGNMGMDDLALLGRILSYFKEGLPEMLLRHLGEEGSISGRKRLSSFLVGLGRAALPAIIGSLHDERWYLVRNLVMILGKIGDSSCIEEIFSHLYHGHFRVQKEVLITLSLIGDDRAVLPIRRILLNRNKKVEPRLQVEAATALKRIGCAKSRRVLQEGLNDKDKQVQEVCCQALKGLI